MYGCDMGSFGEGILVLPRLRENRGLGLIRGIQSVFAHQGVPCCFKRVFTTPNKSKPSCYQL